MKFYCINRLTETGDSANQPTIHLLQAACKSQQVEFVELVSDTFDFAHPPQLNQNDLLYRVATDSLSRQLEKLLLTMQPTSFYADDRGFWWQDNVVKATAVHLAYGLPINKTVFGVSNDKVQLESAVEELGGFPVVIKVAGGSHGVGVIKADSYSSLHSITDYLKQTTDEQFILRQYVEHNAHARIIILNEKVLDSIEYTSEQNDFRTNSSKEPKVVMKDFGTKVNDVAIKAVQVLGLEFGGVDIIIDSEGQPHILEVNFPCFFPRAQQISGVDIAQEIVSYLKHKTTKVDHQPNQTR